MAEESHNFESSMVGAATYDASLGTLTVHLRGKPYTTPGVAPEDWEAFRTSDSPGRWYQQNIQRRRF